MGYFIKRTCILKEISRGYSVDGGEAKAIAKFERNFSGTKFELNAINVGLISKGKYIVLFKTNSGKLCVVDNASLTGTIVANSLDSDDECNFACLLLIEDETKLIPILFGKTNDSICSARGLIDEYEKAESFFREQENCSSETRGEIYDSPKTEYKDEIVATTNYYENNDVNLETLSIGDNYESSEPAYRDKIYDGEEEYSKQSQEEKERFDNANNEVFKNVGNEQAKFKGELAFYNSIKGELDKIFSTYEKESNLCSTVPESNWVKIFYDNEKFYVVGLIYSSGKPIYVCYGLPGSYGDKPTQLKEFCSFIPISIFELKSSGYWVIYQDANTGECVSNQNK